MKIVTHLLTVAVLTAGLLFAAWSAWDHYAPPRGPVSPAGLDQAAQARLDDLLVGIDRLREESVAAASATPDGSGKSGLRVCETALQQDSPWPTGPETPLARIPVEAAPLPETSGESPAAGDPASPDWAARPGTPPVIRRLQAQDPDGKAGPQSEPRRLGLQPRDLGLARQCLDPDPQVRRRLVRMLPEVPGLDAVPWLLELSRDADAEVRLTALTLLATTGDPALVEKVRELTRGDPDPRLQRLADRLGQQPK